jgi:beta-glucosidase
MKKSFENHMVWGAATAAYQIEGATREAGRGRSVWDTFCTRPDKVFKRQTGDIACDHYHRFREDVDLMARMGLQAYRFSVSWPRVLPEGLGKVNHAGLDFYSQLVDALLAKQIQPWLTLFHWDFPQVLHEKGGWLNPDSAKWFSEYTHVMVNALGDRVKHWITINECQMFVALGWMKGIHAPGLQISEQEAVRVVHHSLRAHGEAVKVIRAICDENTRVGVAPVGFVKVPDTMSTADIEAARSSMFDTGNDTFFNNAWFNDAMLFGKYPEEGVKAFEARGIDVPDDDWETIHQPLDFLGVNIYGGSRVRADEHGVAEEIKEYDGFPMTRFNWWVRPEALRWGPRFLYERYGLPIVITENGLSSADWVDLDGNVRDYNRIDFLRRYLIELRSAQHDGAKIDGYFQWSLLDNFEWGEGYKERFGLIYVDFRDGTRTLKESAHWYRKIIESNGAALDQPIHVHP